MPDADEVRQPDVPARVIEVPLRRLGRWLDGFAERHGQWAAERREDLPGWQLSAADGSIALVRDPSWLPSVREPGFAFPPGAAEAPGPAGTPGAAGSADVGAGLGALGALRPCFGVLLIRRAGYAVAVFDGEVLRERKVGSRHIHGRTAAGGWSQQRYARRRANQADEIVGAAAAAADRILGAGALATTPEFLVTGGDRPLLSAVLAQVARQVRELPVVGHLGVGTPDAGVLADIPDRVLSVRIEIREATPAV